jgi:hypothetical protein
LQPLCKKGDQEMKIFFKIKPAGAGEKRKKQKKLPKSFLFSKAAVPLQSR